MSEPPAIFTLPLAVLAFLWACDRRSLWAWLLPGFLFGLTALIRPEYLLGRRSPSPYSPRSGSVASEDGGPAWQRSAICPRRAPDADRPLDGPQHRRARTLGADLDRRRQGALRRHLPSPPTANTSRSRRCSSKRYQHRRTWRHTRRRLNDVDPTPLFDSRRQPLPGTAARHRPRQDRQARLLQVLRRRPDRLPGDDRPQGRTDMEQRRRRGDEQHRRTSAPGADRRLGLAGLWSCSLPPPMVGADRAWRRRSCSSPWSAPSPWPPPAATRS